MRLCKITPKGVSIVGTESLVICQVFVRIPVSSSHYYFSEKKKNQCGVNRAIFCPKSKVGDYKGISVQKTQSKLGDNSICKRMWKGICESKGQNTWGLTKQIKFIICNKPH